MKDFKNKCLENSARKVLLKDRNVIIAVIMRYKWCISHPPYVCDYKDFLGFILLHNSPKLIVKPTSKAGNGNCVIATFGFQTGCREFVWLSYRKQDHAIIEIYGHFLIRQIRVRYEAWSHSPAFSFYPVAGCSLLPCNVTLSSIWVFWLGAIPRVDDHHCIQTE